MQRKKKPHTHIQIEIRFFVVEGSLAENFQNLQFLAHLNQRLEVFSNEGPRPFSRRDNNERVKIY